MNSLQPVDFVLCLPEIKSDRPCTDSYVYKCMCVHTLLVCSRPSRTTLDF